MILVAWILLSVLFLGFTLYWMARMLDVLDDKSGEWVLAKKRDAVWEYVRKEPDESDPKKPGFLRKLVTVVLRVVIYAAVAALPILLDYLTGSPFSIIPFMNGVAAAVYLVMLFVVHPLSWLYYTVYNLSYRHKVLIPLRWILIVPAFLSVTLIEIMPKLVLVLPLLILLGYCGAGSGEKS